ncbi:MAG: TolC family protein [Vicinamibacterales bacterium]
MSQRASARRRAPRWLCWSRWACRRWPGPAQASVQAQAQAQALAPARRRHPPAPVAHAGRGHRPRPGRRRAGGGRARRRTPSDHRRAARPGAPTVTAMAGVLRTNHVDEFGVRQPDGTTHIIFPDLPTNYRVRSELTVPIYTGGRVDALVQAAEADGRAAAADVDTTDADVRLVVSQAYWRLVTARRRVDVLQRALDRADAVVRDAQSRIDAGVAPPNEVLSAQAQRARQNVQLIQARHDAAIAEVTLDRLLGLPADQAIEPTTSVDVPIEGAAALVDVDARTLVSRALEHRPERRALVERAGALRAGAEAAAAAVRPTVAGVAAVEPARPNSRFVPRTNQWQTSWDLGVNVTWPLWDGGRSRAEQAAAAAQAQAVDESVREFDAAVSIEVRERLLDVTAARAALAAAGEAVAAAAEARRVVQERLRAGVATSTDVLDADVAWLEAELEQTQLTAALRLDEARLIRSVGDRR